MEEVGIAIIYLSGILAILSLFVVGVCINGAGAGVLTSDVSSGNTSNAFGSRVVLVP